MYLEYLDVVIFDGRNKPLSGILRKYRQVPLKGGDSPRTEALEHEGIDYYVFNFDEDAKTKMVIDKFIMTIA